MPSSVGSCTALAKLYADNNQLHLLPDEIGQLQQLTHLRLAQNKLTLVPYTIGNLSQLTYMSLFENNLVSIPESFLLLKRLVHLSLEKNSIAVELPAGLKLRGALPALRYVSGLAEIEKRKKAVLDAAGEAAAKEKVSALPL